MATSNIGVTIACPGPVFSDALIHAFTDKPNEVSSEYQLL